MKTNIITESFNQDKPHESQNTPQKHKKKGAGFTSYFHQHLEHRDPKNKNQKNNSIAKKQGSNTTKNSATHVDEATEYFKRNKINPANKNTSIDVNFYEAPNDTKESFAQTLASFKNNQKQSTDTKSNPVRNPKSSPQKDPSTIINTIKNFKKQPPASNKTSATQDNTHLKQSPKNADTHKKVETKPSNKHVIEASNHNKQGSVKTDLNTRIQNTRQNHHEAEAKSEPLNLQSTAATNTQTSQSTSESTQSLSPSIKFTHSTPIENLLMQHIETGKKHIILNLHPHNLGKLTIQINTNQKKTHQLLLKAESENTANILKNEINAITQSIQSISPKFKVSLAMSNNDSGMSQLKKIMKSAKKKSD